jgi:FkbM family methyltransferase
MAAGEPSHLPLLRAAAGSSMASAAMAVVGNFMLKTLKRVTFPARRRLASLLCPAPGLSSHASLSYSGEGEDLNALAWLRVLGISEQNIRYLDIGAAEPIRLSNTYLMSTLGGSGVLVEPDPDQAAELKRVRPRDVVLNVGISFDGRRKAELIRLSKGVFNTFDRAQADKVVSASRDWHEPVYIRDAIEVDLVPAGEVIAKNFPGSVPDFLSIDTEGNDFAILSSIELASFRPKVICVEQGMPLLEYERLLVPHGYRRICSTHNNFVFALVTF